jgi:ectoine hydroxylase-related dioxygenase (phytanoyl-CoA dioxygenase family)
MAGDGGGLNMQPDEQTRLWEEQGFLFLPQALQPSETATLLRAVDAVLESKHGRIFSQDSGVGERTRAFKVANAVTETDALDALIDHPSIFPLLLAFLGPYLQTMGTEIFVRLPGSGQEPLIDWHRDGGTAMGNLAATPAIPILQLKAQFFLTDLGEPDAGNFMLVPGSHRVPFPARGLAPGATPTGAIQLMAQPGDAVLFAWSLWHAVAPNRVGRARKSIAIRYGPMWSRPYDYERLPRRVLERMTPRRRRLFGDLGRGAHPSSYFYPDDDEHLAIMQGDPVSE